VSTDEADERQSEVGPNALRSHGARPLAVLARQLNDPLLILLMSSALVSVFVGEQIDCDTPPWPCATANPPPST
jgi:P-type Mg2+ transporter